MSLATILEAAACLLGLLFGSFLNVVIARVPAGESIVSPRSHCLGCGHAIRWYDNIPLFSYILLRARCRDCGVPISWRYPAVELATAAWFAVCVAPLVHTTGLATDPLLQLILQQVALCTLGWLLIGLAVIDWQTQLLPDTLTIPGIFAGLFFACAQALFLDDNQGDVILKHAPNINSANAGRSPGNIFLTGTEHLIFGRLFFAIAAFVLLWGIGAIYRAIRKRDGIGLGDAKLLAMIAAFLGFQPTILVLFIGVLLATLYALSLLLKGRANAASRLPFGSFLAVAGLFAALEGQRILDWYLGLFP